MFRKQTISVLIPCHNEAKSIEACINSCLNQTRRADEIVVVNDGSTDNTSEILSKFGNKIKIINIPTATGNKSFAQEYGLRYIQTSIFIATDGDTVLHPQFVEHIMSNFKDRSVVAVGGYIKSLKYNWLTACREMDYILNQGVYKVAQSYINAMYVIPGCAGAFRTNIFKKHLKFDHDTLTEDLDFTFRLHKLNFKIKYEKRAIVYTQDPATIDEYTNQMRRWYAGGWQNLLKHYQVLKRPSNAFQLSLVYIDSLCFSLVLIITPFLNIKVFGLMLLSFVVFFLFLGIYSSIIRKRYDLALVSPLCIIFVFINSWIFLEQFINEVLLQKKNLVWFHPKRRIINSA